MDDKKWERLAALGGGVLFTVLVLVSTFLPGAPPELGDKPKEFVKYFTEHGDDIKLASYLGGLAFVPILWWLGSLWRALRRAEGADSRLSVVAVAGLLVGGAIVAIANAVFAVTAIRIEDLGEASRFFFTFGTVLYSTAAFAFAVLVGAVGVLILRTGAFPRWLGLPSLALGVGWLVGGVGTASASTTWATVGMIVFVLWLVWLLTLSVLMYRGKTPASA